MKERENEGIVNDWHGEEILELGHQGDDPRWYADIGMLINLRTIFSRPIKFGEAIIHS